MSRPLVLVPIAVLLSLLCSLQFSQASPSGSRDLVTDLSKISKKVPPLPFAVDSSAEDSSSTGRAGDTTGRRNNGRRRSRQRSNLSKTTGREAQEGEDDYYEEDEVYSLAHFWYNMVEYVHDLVDENNVTFASELSEVNNKVNDLEASLAERDEEVASLREAINKLRDGTDTEVHALGDVRLVYQTEREGGTIGRLLIYAGEDLQWGYVCDDMFYSTEASVACKQLGYSRGIVDVSRDLSLHQGTSGESYSIVLDDVRCAAGDRNLMSCQHEPVGVHNCVAREAVNVACFH